MILQILLDQLARTGVYREHEFIVGGVRINENTLPRAVGQNTIGFFGSSKRAKTKGLRNI